MFSPINIFIVIKKHYENLLEDIKLRFIIIIFFIIPLAVTIAFINYNKILTIGIVNTLITAFTIFTAFLPNVIFIQFQTLKDKVHINASQHLFSNSVYALLISIIILTVLVFSIIINPTGENSSSIGPYLSIIIYFMITHFLMTLLMIIKYLFVLVFPEEESQEESSREQSYE